MEKTAKELIQEQIDIAYKAIKEAEKIANKHNEEFSFSVAYGMGGCYTPPGHEDYDADSDNGWTSSSANC